MSTEKLQKSLGKHWKMLVGDMDDPPDPPSMDDLVSTMDMPGDFVEAWHAVHVRAIALVTAYYAELAGRNMSESEEWLVWMHKEALPLLFALGKQPGHLPGHLPEEGKRVQAYTRLFSKLHGIGGYLRGIERHAALTSQHFLKPVLQAWLTQPKLIANPHAGKDGNPRQLAILRWESQPEIANLYDFDDPPQGVAFGSGIRTRQMLPSIDEFYKAEELAHPLVGLASGAGMLPMGKGRGERMDLRILVHALDAMSIQEGQFVRQFNWELSLGQLVNLLYPSLKGVRAMGLSMEGMRGLSLAVKSSYKPHKHNRQIWRALQSVQWAAIQTPTEKVWWPVNVLRPPDFSVGLESRMLLTVTLPENSRGGAALSRVRLIDAGVIGSTAFRLEIGLAYLWDEAKRMNVAGGKGRRVYATRPVVQRARNGDILDRQGKVVVRRGKPTKNWADPKAVPVLADGRHQVEERNPAADKVRVLDKGGLHRLAYPPHTEQGNPKSKTQFRVELQSVIKQLRQWEGFNRITIERGAICPRTGKMGWRILENRGGL